MALIRGSQVFGHNIRMFGQSIRTFKNIWLYSSIVIFGTIAYFNIDDGHVMGVKAYYKVMKNWVAGDNSIDIPLMNRAKTMEARERFKESGKRARIYMSDSDVEKRIQPRIRYYSYQDLKQGDALIDEMHHLKWRMIHSVWQGVLAGLGLTILIFMLISRRDKKKNKPQYLRGREIVVPKKLNKILLKENKKKGVKGGYSIAGVSYPPNGEMEHLMISGITGSGKTVLLKDLLKQIKEKGDRAIVYDYTGAFIEGFYDASKDIIINPFDARSRAWNLMKEVNNEAEFDTIAEALIGKSDAITDPFWPNGARLIFSELCKIQYKKQIYNTKSLYRYLHLETDVLGKILSKTIANNFVTENSKKTTLSLMMLLITYLKGLQYIENDKEKDFSIKEWLLDDKSDNIVFLSSKSTLHSSVQPIISAIMDIAINNLGELPVGNRKKTWIIFDELASLNYLPSLEQGLTVSRNFGGCFVIALQSISQLLKRYGRDDTETIASNCSNKVILRAGNNETARWASQIIGTQEIEDYKEGISYGAHHMRDGVSINRGTRERQIALSSEILSLPSLEGYLLMSRGYPVTKVNFEHLIQRDRLFDNLGFISNKNIKKES